MKAQGQGVDMAKRGQRQPADSALADLGEDGVAQFVEALRHHPGEPIGDDQGYRNGNHDVAGCQSVDRLLVKQWHVDVDKLAGKEKADRQDDPRPQLERVARPQVGGQRF